MHKQHTQTHFHEQLLWKIEKKRESIKKFYLLLFWDKKYFPFLSEAMLSC